MQRMSFAYEMNLLGKVADVMNEATANPRPA